jgi:hypothetical protein
MCADGRTMPASSNDWRWHPVLVGPPVSGIKIRALVIIDNSLPNLVENRGISGRLRGTYQCPLPFIYKLPAHPAAVPFHNQSSRLPWTLRRANRAILEAFFIAGEERTPSGTCDS